MRRTAILLRNPEQQDDESLVRHIYDNYCIVREKGVNVPVLKNFVQICIQQDIERYGNQHPQFCNSPVDELKKGLDALRDDPVHKLRFQRFVKPMVFGNTQIDWEEAYSCFRQTALSVLTD